MAQVGTAMPSNRLQTADGPPDGPETERQLADCQAAFTQAGKMKTNAAPGPHEDDVAGGIVARPGYRPGPVGLRQLGITVTATVADTMQ